MNGKDFMNFSAFLGILVMLICSAKFQEKQARAGCRISSKQQVIRFDRPLPKQICQSELLRFASQVAEDQTSNAMEDVSCLRPQAESRVPPAPTRRSTILDLVSQSGDHHLLFIVYAT